jgi:ferrochelatase
MTEERAILLLAYGTPRNEKEVAPYLRDIREGKEPADSALKDLIKRYEVIKWSSNLLECTFSLKNKLETELRRRPVYVGMKHWKPFISEAVEQMKEDRIKSITAIPLAPYYSLMSTGGYEKKLKRALEAVSYSADVLFVRSWYAFPAYIQVWKRRLEAAVEKTEEKHSVVFSGHSLPERILAMGDPYRDNLLDCARLIANETRLKKWEFAFTSASNTGEKWLGPSLLEKIQELSRKGVELVVSAPIGFLCDHLEVLYDIDIEARSLAERLGMELVRTRMPNDDDDFVQALKLMIEELDSRASPYLYTARI